MLVLCTKNSNKLTNERMEDLLDENVLTFFNNDSLSADVVDSLFSDGYALLEQNSTPSSGTITPPLPVPPPAPDAPEPRPSTPVTSQPLPSLTRFAVPLSEREIHQLRLNSIPATTTKDTKYCLSVWDEWAKHCQESNYRTIPPIHSLSENEMQSLFVLEVRKTNGDEYPPNSLMHLCCGLVRHLHANGHPNLDLLKDSQFSEFRSTLDAEMK